MNSWGINEERRHFDSIASRTTLDEFKKNLDNRTNEAFWPTILGKIGSLKDKKILDLGCGLGYDSAILASNGAKVIGIDISSGCVEKADLFLRSLGFGRSTQFHVMDAGSLNFPEKYFDLVFGRSVLHHLDLERCLKGIHRIVKDQCCFIEPLESNPVGRISRTGQVPGGESPERMERSPYPNYELSKLIQVMEKEFTHVWHYEYNNNSITIIVVLNNTR